MRRLALFSSTLLALLVIALGSDGPPRALAAGNMTMIDAGVDNSCGVTTAGAAYCWGANNLGQLGNGTTGDPSTVPVGVSGLSSGIAVVRASKGYHACAVTNAGAVLCWGQNDFGQLGDNSTTNSSVPVAVSGLSSGVEDVVLGEYHTCALTTAGGIKCWGAALKGNLGNGVTDTSPHPVPVDVPDLTDDVSAIDSDEYHTCVVMDTGAVKCWGWGVIGQLGDGTYGAEGCGCRNIPVNAAGISGATDIATGRAHTCAVVAGAAKCWGDGSFGVLGQGNTNYSLTPLTVVGLGSGVADIDAGYAHTCARAAITGALACWGGSGLGELGTGPQLAMSLTPVTPIGLGSGVAAISAGGGHSCALSVLAGPRCWGAAGSGQIGFGAWAYAIGSPTFLSGFVAGAAGLVAGFNHTCLLEASGAAACWGDNILGQTGDGTFEWKRTSPRRVITTDTFASISAGNSHTCAVTSGGAAVCWGNLSVKSNVPVPVATLGSGVAAIDAGAGHTCALLVGGTVKCWGSNNLGQTGSPSSGSCVPQGGGNPWPCVLVPYAVAPLSGATAVAAGWAHSCAIVAGGAVKCWGSRPALGNGTTTPATSTTPLDVCLSGSGTGCAGGTALTGATAVAAGQDHTCVITGSEGVKCWGANTYGQLGDGTRTDRTRAVDVTGLAGPVVALSLGVYHTCAVLASTAFQCWGSNQFNKLGVSTAETCIGQPCATTPQFVLYAHGGYTQIAGGGHHTCAANAGGTVSCWGSNGSGQYGNGTQTKSTFPVDTLTLKPIPGDSVGATGNSLTTDPEDDGAHPYDPIETYVYSPVSGPITIDEAQAPVAPPTGYSFAGLRVAITAPTATPTNPLQITFRLDAAAIPAGPTFALIVWRNGTVLPLCTGPTATPDPCLLPGYGLHPDGDLVVVVRTSAASDWDLGFYVGLDDDSDGCTNDVEAGGDPALGGQRDANNLWDFFDVWTPSLSDPAVWERNKVVDLFGDIFGVATRFGAEHEGGAPGPEAFAEAVSPPADATGYHPAYDRSAPIGPDPWDLGPPDGTIDLFTDIFGVANQFGHDCS